MKTNKEIFENRFGSVYIPDNGEGEEITFEEIEADCINEWNSNESLLVDKGFNDIDCFINYVVTSLEWEFPCTVINNLYLD